MNVVLWIVAGLLALAFVAAGAFKLTVPKARLAAAGMAWTEDFDGGAIKGIGLLELLAAVGLVLPALLNVPRLVPLAALGLVAIMLGAAATHLRRKETPMLGLNLVLAVLAALVAWGRSGVVPFAS